MARPYKLPAADKYELRWSGLGFDKTEDHGEAIGYAQVLDPAEAEEVARRHQDRGLVWVSCVRGGREVALAVMEGGVLRRWTG